MTLTARDLAVLDAPSRYYLMCRPQIQAAAFPKPDGALAGDRVMRRRLQELVAAGYISRQRLYPFHDAVGAPLPIYVLTIRGRELLAERRGDDAILRTYCQAPQPNLLQHWLAISGTHLRFDQAAADRTDLSVEAWVNEFDIVNKDAAAPEDRFRLYSLLRRNPRLVCAPDAAFLLCTRGHRKVFYLEQDCGTTGAQQFVARKAPGYAELLRQQKHRQHFPDNTLPTFTVLAIAPDPRGRDALARAMAEKPGAELWRFGAWTDLKAGELFNAENFRTAAGEPRPLVRPAEAAA